MHIHINFSLTAPDPEYNFLKLLPANLQGYIGRPLKLSCLCSEDAQVSWFKDEQEINTEDEHLKTKNLEGEHTLEIAHPYGQDSAKYSCKIIKFGKEGECETSSIVTITGTDSNIASISTSISQNFITSLRSNCHKISTLWSGRIFFYKLQHRKLLLQ